MSTKILKNLTPLLLSFLPLAILFDYLILNNMLNENNSLVTILAFIVNFITALIISFNTISALQRLMDSKLPNYNVKFVKFIMWMIATLMVEYFITIPQISFAISLANGIVTIYVLTLVHQYFKERKQND